MNKVIKDKTVLIYNISHHISVLMHPLINLKTSDLIQGKPAWCEINGKRSRVCHDFDLVCSIYLKHTQMYRRPSVLQRLLALTTFTSSGGNFLHASGCKLFKNKLWIIVPQYESLWLIAWDKSGFSLVLWLPRSLQGPA